MRLTLCAEKLQKNMHLASPSVSVWGGAHRERAGVQQEGDGASAYSGAKSCDPFTGVNTLPCSDVM